jgi:hypothetical protein
MVEAAAALTKQCRPRRVELGLKAAFAEKSKANALPRRRKTTTASSRRKTSSHSSATPEEAIGSSRAKSGPAG